MGRVLLKGEEMKNIFINLAMTFSLLALWKVFDYFVVGHDVFDASHINFDIWSLASSNVVLFFLDNRKSKTDTSDDEDRERHESEYHSD